MSAYPGIVTVPTVAGFVTPGARNFYLASKPTLQIDEIEKCITTMHTELVEKGVEGLDLFDVEAVEAAEASIDQFIAKRSREREEANREEEAWKESTRRVNEKRWRANHAAWADHYEAMYRVHAGLASGHAARAMALRAVGEGAA